MNLRVLIMTLYTYKGLLLYHVHMLTSLAGSGYVLTSFCFTAFAYDSNAFHMFLYSFPITRLPLTHATSYMTPYPPQLPQLTYRILSHDCMFLNFCHHREFSEHSTSKLYVQKHIRRKAFVTFRTYRNGTP